MLLPEENAAMKEPTRVINGLPLPSHCLVQTEKQVADYIRTYPDFPLPAWYAHPVTLKRMVEAIREGRATDTASSLEVVKEDLKLLNSSVEVDQGEYDEVVAIKPLFLVRQYG